MTKRAFTLVELLVVVGIMAAMATMSIGSYFAVVRGMADRGALAAATSIISLAQERSRIDLVPTVVYFYNEIVQNRDPNKGTEMIAAGVAVAIRKAGYITRITGNYLGDEFADLDITYGLADSAGSSRVDTFRLYKFSYSAMAYSLVKPEVVEDSVDGELFLVESPQNRNFRKASGDNEDPTQIISYAFQRTGGNASWSVGDAYGYEFARIRLPDNYIFGVKSDLPDDNNPIKAVSTVIKCAPISTASQLHSVKVTARRPDDWKLIGESKDEMKDI